MPVVSLRGLNFCNRPPPLVSRNGIVYGCGRRKMGVSPAKINVESQLKISYNILASPYLIRTILMCFQSPCERNPCLNGGQCVPSQDSVELTLRRKVNNRVDYKFRKRD